MRSFLLNHEQLHFDLAEVYRRRMVKQIKQTKFSSNYKKEIAQIVNTQQAFFNQEQLKYDRETLHGKDKAEQAKWRQNIKNELLNTIKYAQTKMSIELH